MNVENTLCFSGHRPDKLGGYDLTSAKNDRIMDKLNETIREAYTNGYRHFISGMALGVDMMGAIEVLTLRDDEGLDITLECAIPCAEQYKNWTDGYKELWHNIVEKADKVTYVSNKPYNYVCMQNRNIYMVDNSSLVVAVYDGSAGGTLNCLKYANSKQKDIIIINPKDI